MNSKKIKEILDKHQKWLNDEFDGKKADLSSANLSSTDLRYANLSFVNLSSANLSSADLRYANLSSADLRSTDLRYADLHYTDLNSADLSSANLSYTDLSYTDLRYAKLDDKIIKNINKYRPFQICPQVGSFYAWKAGKNNTIMKIYIPASAERTSCLINRKCRCSKARLIMAWDSKGNKIKECKNWNTHYPTVYKVGEWMIPNSYNSNIRIDCSNGIHFFITKEEAEMFQ